MSKKYYWLKLKDTFFDEEEVKLIENMDNGKDYVILLLKLRLKSINSEGMLVFKNLMPYNEQMIATITNTNIDIVRSALKLFEQLGLIGKLDNGTFYLEQMQELIGSETEWAKKKREYRESKKEDNVLSLSEPSPKLVRQEKEKELDIDIDKTFERLWSLYPRKRGKGSIKTSKKKSLLKDVGEKQLEICIERFKEDMKANNRPIDKYMYGSTFFNTGYVDYLDDNYKACIKEEDTDDDLGWIK